MSTSDLISVLSLALGLSSAAIGIIFWYRGMIRKSYAAERDFGHLKRHYEGLALGQEAMLKELDTRCDAIERQLIRIEAAIASRNN